MILGAGDRMRWGGLWFTVCKLHSLSTVRWSVWVNGNWRMTFEFEGDDAIRVDYEGYH